MKTTAPPLRTQRLELVPQTRDEMIAMIDAMPPDLRREVSQDYLAMLAASPPFDPWIHGFRTLLQGKEIGMAAFKGPPDAEGMVEVAYGIEPAHEGKGYATEVAAALTDYALRSGEVRFVRAHTLAETNASTRVLTKCGFTKVGEVVDPEDGLVWRWELRPEPLFSYGTLQQSNVQLATFGRLLSGRTDALVGFEQSMYAIDDAEVVKTSGKTHHPIVRFTGDDAARVPGTVFEITPQELAQADRYEVATYKRVSAPLASGGKAWVYVDAKFAPPDEK
jgi:RimJ/RimL family protein N-acetyltransferase